MGEDIYKSFVWGVWYPDWKNYTTQQKDSPVRYPTLLENCKIKPQWGTIHGNQGGHRFTKLDNN